MTKSAKFCVNDIVICVVVGHRLRYEIARVVNSKPEDMGNTIRVKWNNNSSETYWFANSFEHFTPNLDDKKDTPTLGKLLSL